MFIYICKLHSLNLSLKYIDWLIGSLIDWLIDSLIDWLMPAFAASQYIVKSYSRSNGLPHLIACCENGLNKCDSNCPRYNSEGCCGHTIAVALKNTTVQSFTSALSKCNEKTTTSVASQKIKSNVVGRKVPVRIRKPPLEVLKNFQPQQSGIQLSKYLTSVTQLWFMIHLKPII